MKGFYSVLLVFVILYMLYLPVSYLKYTREADAEFSGLLLAKAVDYAGEAAMAACIEVANLEFEYTDNTTIVMSPEKAADTFASALCLSYGLPDTEYNKDSIKNKIPVMVLAANDGYHIAERQETGNGESALMWGLKKPYIIDTDPENPGEGTAYSIELGSGVWRTADKATLTLTAGDDYSALPFSRETMLQYVNRDINRDINAVLARFAAENNIQNAQLFYLPFSENTAGVRRIDKPGLLIVLQDLDLDGVRPVSLSVVNGMAVDQRQYIVGWTDGSGRMYYCRQGDADSAAQSWIELNGVVFDTIEDAARAGYMPYGIG